MRARDLMRALTPLGWLVLAGAMVVLLAIAGRGVGLRWDPFDLQKGRLEAAQAQATRAESDAEARRLEAAGRDQQAAGLEIHH